MSFYSRMQKTADRILKKYGQSITVIRQTAGEYDPATGESVVTTTTQTGTCAIFEHVARNIDGTLIKQGDKQLLLSAFTTDGEALSPPEINDTVVISSDPLAAEDGSVFLLEGGAGNELLSGTVYAIVAPLKKVSPAGTVILYELNLRA